MQLQRSTLVAAALVLSLAVSVESAVGRTVTNEDIRDAILSFLHMFRDVGNKLERHELREKQLGEELKTILALADKRGRSQDSTLEIIVQTLNRMDKRLQKIESSISNDNAKEKGLYTVDTMNDSIQTWMSNMEALWRNQSNANDQGRMEAVNTSLNNIMSQMEVILARLEMFIQRPQPTVTDVVNYEGVISRFEDKLSQLRSNNQNDLASSLQSSLNKQERMINDLKDSINSINRNSESLPTKQELQEFLNSSREENQELKYELISANEKEVAKLEMKLDVLKGDVVKNQDNIYKTLNDAGELAEGFYADVQKSYEQLQNEVKALNKVEQVLIQTADNVLDTKRRIEYGVHQILLEVGDLVKIQAKDLNETVNKRFDDISDTIVVNHNGGFNNLSTKIETEISQVWRQIGIMYQQLTASAGALDRLQQQTELYVNGSLQTMDSMEGKVGQITGRMTEVDDNLNYLLGRLSLVTHEFNQIKSGLGAALDNIRSSFMEVQSRVKDVGPGPNPIESSDTDFDPARTELDNKL
ncbi:uncharacterized protein LOC111049215 [Nilaparvata lugens]|uniref:uncharacterized protein LOC111049215 n=1 Tax=Nilaparvata lugens TaxID=108931 RepID=UPI00193D58DF|nr:uncharacterized protein LOC111049215 [Nilaparvata lugens]